MRKRSVYCGWCYELGHNRAGCPTRKTYISDNPDSWEAHKEKEKVNNRREVKRKCSYCSGPGHQRRTCSVIKNDRVRLVKHLKAERADLAQRFCRHGFGIGALVEIGRGHYSQSPTHLAVVTELDWRKVDSATSFYAAVSYVADGNRQVRRFKLPRDGQSEPIPPVVSPISMELICGLLPSTWVDGTWYDEGQYFEGKGEPRLLFFFKLAEEDGLEVIA